MEQYKVKDIGVGDAYHDMKENLIGSIVEVPRPVDTSKFIGGYFNVVETTAEHFKGTTCFKQVLLEKI